MKLLAALPFLLMFSLIGCDGSTKTKSSNKTYTNHVEKTVEAAVEQQSVFTETRNNLFSTEILAEAFFKGSTKRKDFYIVTRPDVTTVSGPDTSFVIEKDKEKVSISGYLKNENISLSIRHDAKDGDIEVLGYIGDISLSTVVRNLNGDMQIIGTANDDYIYLESIEAGESVRTHGQYGNMTIDLDFTERKRSALYQLAFIIPAVL